MATWHDVEGSEPEFAQRVRELFDAGRHKTIATLRADGSPRISGTECEFVDGNLRFGSMTGSRKGDDLRRDSRFALHGPTFHPEQGNEAEWSGEAKIAGRAVSGGPITVSEDGEFDSAGEGGDGDNGSDADAHGEWFIADIDEVVVTGLNEEATMLRIEWWTPSAGLRVIERA